MQVTAIKSFLAAVLVKKGMYAFEAEIVADRIIDAEQLGQKRHGCSSLEQALRSIDMGDIDPRAVRLMQTETAAIARINANEGMGQVAGTVGVELAITKAKELGIGLVMIENSQCFGSPLVYARLAALQGMIACCMTSTADANDAKKPEAEKKPHQLGQQPAAVAVPAASGPLGWQAGFGSDDAVILPDEFGFSWGLVHAVCTSALAGQKLPHEKTRGLFLERTEHFLLVIDPEKFVERGKFDQKIDALCQHFSSLGHDLFNLPAHLGQEMELTAEVFEQWQEIARKLKIEYPGA